MGKSNLQVVQFETIDAKVLGEWGYNKTSSGLLMFIHFAPHAFFTLLHQRRPTAVLFFASFDALLNTAADDFWLLEEWRRDIVGVVDDLLGSY